MSTSQEPPPTMYEPCDVTLCDLQRRDELKRLQAKLADRAARWHARLIEIRGAGLRFKYINLADAEILQCIDIGMYGWVAAIGHPHDASYEWVGRWESGFVDDPSPPRYEHSNCGYGGAETALREGLLVMSDGEEAQLLDDVSASLETVLLHLGDQMPEADRGHRETIVRRARALCDRLLRREGDAP